MRVDGIIITTTQDISDNSIFYQINKLGVALTFLDCKNSKEGFYEITADYYLSAYLATEIAIKTGYRKFLYISENNNQSIFKNGFLGFKSALMDYDCPINDNIMISAPHYEKTAYDIFIEYYKSRMIPDCIFCSNLQIALGLYRAVIDVEMRVPDNIDFIISGHYPIDYFFVRPIAYIEQPLRALGKTAIEMTVNNILRDNSFTSKTMKVPVHINVRESATESGKYIFKRIFKYPCASNPGVLKS